MVMGELPEKWAKQLGGQKNRQEKTGKGLERKPATRHAGNWWSSGGQAVKRKGRTLTPSTTSGKNLRKAEKRGES